MLQASSILYSIICCHQAKNPIRADLVKALGIEQLHITCGAVCVYPSRVPDVRQSLKDCGGLHIPIASGMAIWVLGLGMRAGG